MNDYILVSVLISGVLLISGYIGYKICNWTWIRNSKSKKINDIIEIDDRAFKVIELTNCESIETFRDHYCDKFKSVNKISKIK